jgi:uncharacterized protein YkwD
MKRAVFVIVSALAVPLVVFAPGTANAATAQETAIAQAVLAELNAERAAVGAPKVTMHAQLVASAAGHNAKMASSNQMSHQLPGEASFDKHITNAGYPTGRAMAENLGVNAAMTQAGAIHLEKMMFAEGPGAGTAHGHYTNIVNKAYKNVGISILFDLKNKKLWLTEDFAG